MFETEGGNWTAKEDGSFEQSVFAYYTSISCNHCSNPSCLKACPTIATMKIKWEIVEQSMIVCV
ncbi:hypothetical protein ACFK4Z_000586 [Campylobacter jejuni]